MTGLRSSPRDPAESGFTLVEALVAVLLATVVFSVVFLLLSVQLPMARTQTDAADAQQRARVATDILSADLGSAGAWADHGNPPGPHLACCVPVLHPRRLGLRLADPPGVARADALTLVRLSQAATPGRLREPLGAALALEPGGGCVASRPVCGLREDDAVIVFDAMGRHDFLLLGPPGVDSAPFRPRQAASPYAFGAGATAAGVETLTYYLDVAARQLRRYDGYLSDVPIVDDVVDVRFEYWGAPGIPARARSAAGTATCWFDVDGQPRAGRVVTPPGAPNVRLALAEFQDGPWCGTGENRFDADLLRVRHVTVTVRIVSSSEMARGTGAGFALRGRANNAVRLVPDLEAVVQVTPRNLNGDY